jgi:hypothetical protein
LVVAPRLVWCGEVTVRRIPSKQRPELSCDAGRVREGKLRSSMVAASGWQDKKAIRGRAGLAVFGQYRKL